MSLGGAQAALLTYWATMTVMSIAFRVSGSGVKLDNWGYRFTGKLIERSALALVLWWGGFWS